MFSVRISLLLLSVIFYFEACRGQGYPSGSPSNPLEVIANPPTTTTPKTEHDPHHHHHHGEDGKYDPKDDGTGWDIRKSVPGEPGVDYPTYAAVPTTSFTCISKKPGYYADKETRCQAFRVCMEGARNAFSSFLCPNGSIFNQEVFACDWWNKVNCEMSDQFYDLNDRIDSPSSVSIFMDKVKNMLDYPVMNPIISDNSIDNQQSDTKLVLNSEGYLPPTTRKYYSPTVPTTTPKYSTPVLISNIGSASSTLNYLQPSTELQTPSSFAPYPSSSTSRPSLNNQYLTPSTSGHESFSTFSQHKHVNEYIPPNSFVSSTITSTTSSERPKVENQQFVNAGSQQNYVTQEQNKPTSFQPIPSSSDGYRYPQPSSYPERSGVIIQQTVKKNDFSQVKPVQISTTTETIKQKQFDPIIDQRFVTLPQIQSSTNSRYENDVSTVKPIQNIPAFVQNYNQQFDSTSVLAGQKPSIFQNNQNTGQIQTSVTKSQLSIGNTHIQQGQVPTLNIIPPSSLPKVEYETPYPFIHSQISHEETPVTHRPDYQSSNSYDSSKQSFIHSQHTNLSPLSSINSLSQSSSLFTESPEIIKVPLSSTLKVTTPDTVNLSPKYNPITEHSSIPTTQRPFSSSTEQFSSTLGSIKSESDISTHVPSVVAHISANKVDEPRKFGVNSLSSAITISNQQNDLKNTLDSIRVMQAKTVSDLFDVRNLDVGAEIEDRNDQISQKNQDVSVSTGQRGGHENTINSQFDSVAVTQRVTDSFPTTATYSKEQVTPTSGGHFGQIGILSLSPVSASQNSGSQFAERSGFINSNTFTNVKESSHDSGTPAGNFGQSGVSQLSTDSVYQNLGLQLSQGNDVFNTAEINKLQENVVSDGAFGQLGISNVSPSSAYQNEGFQFSQKSTGNAINEQGPIAIVGNVENLGQFGLGNIVSTPSYQSDVSQFVSNGGISNVQGNVGNIDVSNVSPTPAYQNEGTQFAQRNDISNLGTITNVQERIGSNFGQTGTSQLSTIQNEAPQVSFINYSGNEQTNNAVNTNSNANNGFYANQNAFTNSYSQAAANTGGFSQITSQNTFQSTPAPVHSSGTQNYPGQNVGVTIPRYSTSDTAANNAGKTKVEYSVNIVPALSYSFDTDSEKEAYVNDFVEGRFEMKSAQNPSSFTSSFLNRNANIQSNNNFRPLTSSINSNYNGNGYTNGKFVGHSSYLAPQGSIEKLPQDTGAISQSYGSIGHIEEGYIRNVPSTQFEGR